MSPKHHGALEASTSMRLLSDARPESAREQTHHGAKPDFVPKHHHVAEVKTVAS